MTAATVIAARPGLYDPEATTTQLFGDRCEVCATAYFPALRWGCERCGAPAEQLVATELAPVGRLLSFATVQRMRGVEVPYTIGEILLDAGPVIRARVLPDDGAGLRFDARVHGRLLRVGRDEETGADTVDLRFVLEAED
jgi:uncharacterized protein